MSARLIDPSVMSSDKEVASARAGRLAVDPTGCPIRRVKTHRRIRIPSKDPSQAHFACRHEGGQGRGPILTPRHAGFSGAAAMRVKRQR